ncbi:MarR family transcriptional regulator [Corynebacterium bovis]|uniref:MarR family transcriptional regulator n=1 Tax=Corynebacterium bovis TaxID=36808 RepID=A0A3R8QLN6_9CORY|nr:MarR family transcriptional regulator [Corynebacterium bovis]RRO85836.1 MarR family transcriptional regulator [Corynebacterium bovis]
MSHAAIVFQRLPVKVLHVNTEIGTRIEVGLRELLRRDTRERLYLSALDRHQDVLDAVRYPALAGIYWYGPINAAGLGRRLGLDRTVVSRYAAVLEKSGRVRREPDPSDKRASLLSVTDDGRAIMEDIRRHLATVITDSVSDWPEGLALAFAEGLERFASATGSAPVDPGMPGE